MVLAMLIDQILMQDVRFNFLILVLLEVVNFCNEAHTFLC